MKVHIFSGQDALAVLGFLARLETAWVHNGVTGGAVEWSFQSHWTGQTHALLHSRLAGSSMAVNAGQLGMLETYLEGGSFLLCADATDEVVAASHTDLVTFRKDSNTTE